MGSSITIMHCLVRESLKEHTASLSPPLSSRSSKSKKHHARPKKEGIRKMERPTHSRAAVGDQSHCEHTMASEDLLAKLTVLHNYVERELQGVVTVVSDLGVDERPTRILHAILTQARERIQTALARQRMLLWKFSMESSPAVGHATTAGGERVQLRDGRKYELLEELAVGSIRAPQDCGIHTTSTCATTSTPCRRWPENSNKNDGNEGAKVQEDLEWKRDTLVRMKHLLQRKAGDYAADEADTAALTRDILKVRQALEQVQRQTNDVHQKKLACADAPTRSAETAEEGYNAKNNAGAPRVEPSSNSGRTTCRRDEQARESATSTTTSSGSTAKRCGIVAREQQEEEKGVATESVGSAQSVQNADLRLPE